MHRKIRIVRIFSRLNIGGPSVHVILLTALMDPARFESTLVVGQESPHEGNMYDLAERHGVKPLKLDCLGREISLWHDLKSTFELWRLLRKGRPHVVHTHTSKAGFSGRLAARLAGVPVVIHTFHGHTFGGYFGPLTTHMFVILERALARVSDAVITISDRLRHELLERRIGSEDKIRVIALGLELEDFLAVEHRSGVLRSAMGARADEPIVGIVGRLVPIKDHHTFLRAAEHVSARRPDARFAIVGDGELCGQLKRRASASAIRDRVHFAGWRRDLAAVYADLDLVVISSKNEGTPVSIIEGAAAGRPVVATAVGGVPDMITDGWDGLLVPPGDPQALAAGILRILEDPGLAARLAARARARVRDRYDIRRLTGDLGLLYTDLLRSKGIHLSKGPSPADPILVP